MSNGTTASVTRSIPIYGSLLFGMAFFGSGTPAAKIVTGGFPLFLGPFLRLLLAAVLTTPILVLYRDDLRRGSRGSWLYIFGIGSIGLVAFSIFLLTGMKMVNGVVGAMVMSLSPAAVALGATWFLGDRLGWRKIVAVILSVAGVLIINVSGKSIQAQGGWHFLLGSLLVFGAVCSATIYSLFAKKASTNIRAVLLVPLAAWVAVALFAIPAGYQAILFDFAAPTLNEWAALAWWGVGPFAIGTMLWFIGLKSVKASTASGFMGAMPASGLLVSYFWLEDEFYWIHLVGFALVLGGIGMVSWAHRHGEKEAKEKGEEYSTCHLCPG
ncbi:MAG: DMT family transporter [Planctomycetota bacterium]